MEIRFITTGCRLNQIESESAARFFVEKSFSVSLNPVSASDEADGGTILCVVNTCAVTQKAEQKDRRLIRLALEKFPHAAVVVTGCYAQLAQDVLAGMGLRVAVLPGQRKSRLEQAAALLREQVDSGGFSAAAFADALSRTVAAPPQEEAGTGERPFRLSTESFLAHSRPSIKIQDGCSNACTYCAIRLARGRSVSLDAEEVLSQVRRFEAAGCAEVVFTSVNLAQYRGAYKGRTVGFAELLELCLAETERLAFRISSLYPELVDGRFCAAAEDPRVRPHFHLSVQSGSDAVLQAMGRRYRAADVAAACRLLRSAKRNPFVACDIITGFPGETEDDFERTAALCRDCSFSWIHVFPFSARPGTAAAGMRPAVPQSVSGRRAAFLAALAAERKKAYIDSCRGAVLDAVLEPAERRSVFGSAGGLRHHAVTENFLHCELSVPHGCALPAPGRRISVRIVEASESGMKKGGGTECLAELVLPQPCT